MYNFPYSIYPLNRKSSYFDQTRAYRTDYFETSQGDSSTSCLLCVTINRTYSKGQSQYHQHIKTTVWAISFEPEVVESHRDFWLDVKCYWWKHLSELSGRHDPFLCHVTSNKTYDLCMFSKFINVCTDWSQNWHTHSLDLNYVSCKKMIWSK